ncbi:unnamed protein product [Linum trigynum]|uniref:Cytochrome P450 n=1 Tax=Linum trigynum TaxID=586398 RepID=A0AAV2CPC0_9ROSI
MATLLLLVFFLPLLLCLVWFAVRNKKKAIIIPNWPVVGMLPSLLWNVSHDLLHDFITRIMTQSGGTFRFKGPWFAGVDFLITVDPMNVHYILSKNFTNFPKGPNLKAILEPLGDGIFNTDGESWKSQRETIHSLINTTKFHHLMLKTLHRKLQNGLIPILHDSSSKLHNSAPLPPPLDLQELMKRLTFDTICSLVTGFDPKYLSIELPSLPYADAFDVIEQVILYRHCVPATVWKFQRWVGIGEERKMREAQECFDEFLEERIRVKRKEALDKKEMETVVDDDFLTMILSGEAGIDQGKLTNVFLRDVVFNLLVAGRDTIAAALSWFFWLVSENPNVEEKILKELDQVMGKETSFPSTEELNKMVYLHGAMCETLRLYPSVPYEHKQSIEPDVLPSGHAIDGNTRILLSIFSMGRMEEIWGVDWMDFKPERWISVGSADEKKTVVNHVPSYKFAAFMAGPRTCLGRKIAFVQMKAVASCVLRRFKIEVVDGHPVVPDASILMFMKYGLKVRVSNRAR